MAEDSEVESGFKKFEESLKSLSLEGIILIQGLLAQRALELLSQPKKSKKESIIKPKVIF